MKEHRRTLSLGDYVKVSGTIERMRERKAKKSKREQKEAVEIVEEDPTEEKCGGLLLHVINIEILKKHVNVSGSVQSQFDKKIRDLGFTSKKLLGADEVIIPLCIPWYHNSCNKSDCNLRHYLLNEYEKERLEFLEKDAKERKQSEHDSDDPFEDKSQKRLRAPLFVDWLIQTYGIDYLNSGTGVIDIAGGRGSISFELFTMRGIKSTLIEPRPMKLNKNQHRYMKQNSGASLCSQIRALFDADFLADENNRKLVENSSILIGMHPDQATEAIMDAALQFKKPFAIVPCCVFNRLFPERRSKDGKQVVLYSEFVQYLQDKEEGINVDFLVFRGRNKVIYRK
eukprot:TRINITY_DN6611_c0_g1_i1.p1 TRINITY_DN6611_c0_g1~~TRINITY_DN6611_c0_g1_i1.p1  ORF type:complete len:341 (-),score=75.38 TRINITY_DN6611_c0_g1_i1:42-1064(-)